MKKVISFTIAIICAFTIIILFQHCKSDDDNQPTMHVPTVLAKIVTNVYQDEATSGGSIQNQGSSSITSRGICWSTSPSPTVADDKIEVGGVQNDFSATITGLSSNTTYFIRAYAINADGVGYGEAMEFKTLPGVPGEKMADINGNVYHTVQIGSSTWTIENLKVTKYSNGEAIAKVTDNTEWSNLETGAYVNFTNGILNAKVEGIVYNGFAVMDSRGLAPDGWHIATAADWDALLNTLGDNAGLKIRAAGKLYWGDYNQATNDSGLTLLPFAYRDTDGSMINAENSVSYWSASYSDQNHIANVVYTTNALINGVNSTVYLLNIGLPVRCVKNQN